PRDAAAGHRAVVQPRRARAQGAGHDPRDRAIRSGRGATDQGRGVPAPPGAGDLWADRRGRQAHAPTHDRGRGPERGARYRRQGIQPCRARPPPPGKRRPRAARAHGTGGARSDRRMTTSFGRVSAYTIAIAPTIPKDVTTPIGWSLAPRMHSAPLM